MSGLHGHLDLLCARDARGESSLQRQSFRAPFHISKPHRDAGVLVVNVANPTAGFLAGDRAECRVEVAAGAALLLTTPAANRAFRMREGSEATLEQSFAVGTGGFLEVWPEPFIPQAGTRYRQRTELRAAAGAEALFFEALAPGRVASGEAFAYASLRWETDLWWDDVLVGRERYTLEPESLAVRALRGQFSEAYYASCFLLTDRVPAGHPCWMTLGALQGPEVWLGASPLVSGGWTIKILASGSIALRRALARVRNELYGAVGRRMPDLRRASAIG